MGLYTSKGAYNGYNKSNAERAEGDYYATPPLEVYNILNTLKLDLSGKSILDPCVGGGHMLDAIIKYCDDNQMKDCEFLGSDLYNRGYDNPRAHIEYNLDFLDYNNYKFQKADVIVLNPPFSDFIPFINNSLKIAQEKLIVFVRLQAMEGTHRYEDIWKDNPFNIVYVYIDRVNCWKNGEKPTTTSSQAYGWFVWDRQTAHTDPTVKWISRLTK